ncbi:MAG: type II secretion system ATPase GspE [Candidatus Babeliaceae bacterium]
MLKKSISEILIDQKKITAQEAHQLHSESSAVGQTFEHYIVEQNKIPALDIAQAYASKFEVPFLEVISQEMASPEILAKIPLKFLREQVVIPIQWHDNKIMIVTANPFDFQPIDELNVLFGGDTLLGVAMPAVIIEGINRYYPLEGTQEMIAELQEETALSGAMDFEAIQEEDILGMATEAPIIKLVNHILYQAIKRDASDIHIEPFEKELRIRYRIDGVLYTTMTPPKRIQGALASRLKIMANLNIAEKRQPQDGRIQIKIADKAIDIRVSILPVTHGERIVMRLLDKTKTFGKLKNLGFSERDYGVIEQSIKEPNGILLITGPTGSGKTSTLYSILSELNAPDVNIVTVEDPVEYQMAGVGQVQVREKIGLTFAAALRSILRQDPDIVMIGETRDQETAQIAIQAALTGHLVLSTVHTNSAAATITRLIDMGIEPFLIASTIVSVVAQRLVRKLCSACKVIYTPTAETLKRLSLSSEAAAHITFYDARGCNECLQTGYKGRLAIFEIMVMTHQIARMTINRTDTALIQQQAQKDGMTLLIQDGIRKITLGLTTIEEVLSVATAHDIE